MINEHLERQKNLPSRRNFTNDFYWRLIGRSLHDEDYDLNEKRKFLSMKVILRLNMRTEVLAPTEVSKNERIVPAVSKERKCARTCCGCCECCEQFGADMNDCMTKIRAMETRKLVIFPVFLEWVSDWKLGNFC